MLRCLVALFVLGTGCLVPGCATVLLRSTEEVSIRTRPSGARVTIFDQRGVVAFRGTSPATLRLKKKIGYLEGADYKVDVELEGYESRRVRVRRGVSPWYFGNALLPLGSLVGLVLIDPWTGCMWTLEVQEPEIVLEPSPDGVAGSPREATFDHDR